MQRHLRSLFLAIFTLTRFAQTWAQAYPNRPTKTVMDYSAGGRGVHHIEKVPEVWSYGAL